ncbi:MAG TPA: hypothetical protein VKS80_04940, partial [Trinickia sp.]|nr:hypothetical protein [Trinickia sp.]
MNVVRTRATLVIGMLTAVGSMLASMTPAAAQYYGNYGNTSGYGGLADLSYASYGTTIIRGDSGSQFAGSINAPLAPGDYVVTGNGDAEIQFDGNSVLRIAPNSQVRMVNVSPGSREVQVGSGTA